MTRRLWHAGGWWVAAVLVCARAPAAVIYVQPGAGGGAGASWASAYTNLSQALAAAIAGDALWVAAGTYRPGAAVSDTFQLRADVAVLGGFTGAETDISQRNWRVTHTILSGDLLGDDTVAQGQRADNAAHVILGAAGATLDGMIVRSGYAPAGAFGGALVIDGVAMTIRNCVFVDNAAHSGGALFIDNGAAPLFTDCIFSGNGVHGEYAGVAYGNNAAFPEFRRCVFAGNRSSEHGGVFYTGGLSGWSVQVFNCLFAGNFAGWDGGVAYFRHSGANPQIGNCTIAGNTRAFCVNADLGGGNIKFFNSIIWSNAAYQYSVYAGRINTTYTDLDQAPNYNAGNTIRVDPAWRPPTGGTWTSDALFEASRGLTVLIDATADWTNNAFAGQCVAVDLAHAERLQFAIASNTIHHLYVWGDASALRGLAHAGDTYQITDYHLQTNSPCANFGMVPWWDDGDQDIEGAVRPWDGSYDLGAYESGAPRPPPLPEPTPTTLALPPGLWLLIR